MPLINCEIELYLPISKAYIISEISITPAVAGNSDVNPPVLAVAAIQTTRANFQTMLNTNAKHFKQC